MPLKNTPAKVPAPPMLATSAPTSESPANSTNSPNQRSKHTCHIRLHIRLTRRQNHSQRKPHIRKSHTNYADKNQPRQANQQKKQNYKEQYAVVEVDGFLAYVASPPLTWQRSLFGLTVKEKRKERVRVF